MTKKIKIVVCLLFLSVLVAIIYFDKTKEEQRVVIIDGFEVEYKPGNREVSVEQFMDLDLGSSMNDIEEKFGNADTWVGGGITRPVYFLREDKIVVLYFANPFLCEDLMEIVMYDLKGVKSVIKTKE